MIGLFPNLTYLHPELMGKLKGNVLIEGMSGQLDRVLLKQYHYGTVISKMPDRSKVKLTAHQKKQNSNFQQAVHYAKSVLADSSKRKAYEKKAKQEKRSVYHVALSDFLKKNPVRKAE
jgi:hypothetical protein